VKPQIFKACKAFPSLMSEPTHPFDPDASRNLWRLENMSRAIFDGAKFHVV